MYRFGWQFEFFFITLHPRLHIIIYLMEQTKKLVETIIEGIQEKKG